MIASPAPIPDPQFQILQGDVIEQLRQLASESVHCVVTSPPYWGLRDYGIEPSIWADGWRGCLGLEPSPEMFLDHMLEVFRHVRRVLHSSASVWLNMGDSYACHPHTPEDADPKYRRGRDRAVDQHKRLTGLKPKDMVMMPAHLALALQADGWFLRSQIPWVKRNGMPESTMDRPTSMVEYIFLLSKSESYFYDKEAVRIASTGNGHSRGTGVNPKAMGPNSRMHRDQDPAHQTPAKIRAKQNRSFSAAVHAVVPSRARRNTDWLFSSIEEYSPKFSGLLVDGDSEPLAMIVNPQPFALEMCEQCGLIYSPAEFRKLPIVCAKEGTVVAEKACSCGCAGRRRCTCEATSWVSHFATFPERLVEPCILAGTSEFGCCHHCGAPYERILEKQHVGDWHPDPEHKHANGAINGTAKWAKDAVRQARNGDPLHSISKASGAHDRVNLGAPVTEGWRPTCSHPLFPSEVIPCTVLDIFSGSGRTGLAANRLGRNYIGIERNPRYVRMAEWQAERTREVSA